MVLGEQPAKRGIARIGSRQLVGAFGQPLGKRGEAPRGPAGRVVDRGRDLELAAARKDDETVGLGPVEALRLDQRAIVRGPFFQPVVEAGLVDQVDGARRLAAVGD